MEPDEFNTETISPAITRVERYKTPDGREFESEQDALSYVQSRAENFIGNGLDRMPLGIRERLAVCHWAIENRKELIRLLNF